MSPPSRPAHRTDFDGLRAIAILLVVLFHAFPGQMAGGFVGVDMFLVLSGYLVTGSVMPFLQGGSGGPWRFYVKRALRILPSLLVVLLACLILGWVLLLPGEYLGLGKHVAGGAALSSNLLLYSEAGYFDNASESKPLLHLWYLGVDAQFCLIYPLALLLISKLGGPVWRGVLVLAAISFGFNLFQVSHDPSGAYFLPMARAWELLLGALLAVRPQARQSLPCAVQQGLALAGSGLIILAALMLNRSYPYPGWWALLPTLGTAALILAGPGALINRQILAHPLLTAIGAVSYPLYLWHWPLLTFLRLQWENAPPAWALWAAVGLSLLAAWATLVLVERPLAAKNREGRTKGWVLAGLALCIPGGLTVQASGGMPQRMPLVAAFDAAYANQNYSLAHDLYRHDRQECNFYDGKRNAGKTAIDPSCHEPRTDKMVLVWGDSHSQHLQYGLKNALPDDVSLLQIAASGCIPSLKAFDDDPVGACNRANAFALQRIAELKPQIVLLAQEGHHEENDYPALITRLRQLGVGTIILPGPVPHWKPHLYQVVERKYQGQPPRHTWDNIQADSLATDRYLKDRFATSTDVLFLSLYDALCDARGCPVYLGDDPLTSLTSYDYGHFTLPMSGHVGKAVLAPAIMAALRRGRETSP